MPEIVLSACSSTPFGSYLKALGIFRLISEQCDPEARGSWQYDFFTIHSKLDSESLTTFLVEQYEPTPILAPWNGGSGFYPKDKKDGIDAIAASLPERFADYRTSIEICRDFPEVAQGKGDDEESRRTIILRKCRNQLPDRAVDWLDAAVGIASDGSRSFAPVLGTGGNEGRLDYTNNFMLRIAALLVAPDPKLPVRDLLANALFGYRTTSLQPGAAGQYDPGRAGGANQGSGISNESATNPWDLVFTLEGAVAWASGLYRRQGASYGSFLCSPFTVRARSVGYGSAGAKDDARAEIWTPIWRNPVRYDELRLLLREGRASIGGKPAGNALEFAEAAASLGVDRGIDAFVRYSLLKRRGDSYVALPTGTFSVKYRSSADRIRELQHYLDALDRIRPKTTDDLRRTVDKCIFEALLTDSSANMRELMAALGRLLCRAMLTVDPRVPSRRLPALPWLTACDFNVSEVRIAAALASLWTPDVGAMSDHLVRADKRFSWTGSSLTDRMIAVLDRRLQIATAAQLHRNPLGGACAIHPGETTRFIDGSIDENLIEDLLFAFTCFDWSDFQTPAHTSGEIIPAYAAIKYLFLAGEIRVPGREDRGIASDPRIVSLLNAGRLDDASAIAVNRLRISGFHPLNVHYLDGLNARRLAAALLIPIRPGYLLSAGIFHPASEESAPV